LHSPSANISAKSNKLYDDKKYAEGEVAYRKAIDKTPNRMKQRSDVGNSLYKQGKASGSLQHNLEI